MKLDLLVFAAHPDDAELGCSGSLIKAIDSGKKVGIIDLTQGELGTRGSVETREKEAQDASAKMGVIVRENLKMADGFFSHSHQNLLKIVEVIRKYKPEIVLANAVYDRHPDHAKASKLVSEACFLSGLAKLETKMSSHWQEKWRPSKVYHYIQDRNIEPDFVIDITPYFKQKIEVIKCFSSQFFDPENAAVQDETPISGKDFWMFLEARAREMGRKIGVEFGEGFTSEVPLALKDFWSI